MAITKEAIIFAYQFALRYAIPGGAAILTVTAFASYALGLLRDRLFAVHFGAGAELDAYNASFLIPDLLLNIFVAGALSAAFIPLFSGLLGNKKTHQAHQLANSVLNSAVLVISVFGILVFITAPFLTRFIAPGFTPENHALLANLLRIMIVSPLIFALSNTLGGMLIGYRRMLYFGLSPAFYNAGIIGGTLVLVPHIGVYGVAVGTIIGAFLHLSIRVVGMRGLGFRWRRTITVTRDFRRVIKLMIPKMFGHPVELMTFWGFTAIASTLGEGNIAVLNFARNFQSVPVALFGISFALASFPVLSEHAAKNDFLAFRRQFFKTLRGILFLTTSAAIGIFFLRVVIIQFFLGGGAFGRDDVLLTAAVLGVFTLAIPTESTNHLLARSFYALQNTLIPTLTSILGLAIAIGLAFSLSPHLGIAALPLAFFIGSITKLVILSVLLQRRVKLTG